MEIVARGVDANMLVVGKPVLTTDATNTGWMSADTFKDCLNRAYSEHHFYAGAMIWQYSSDANGTWINAVTGDLVKSCAKDGNCV